MTTPPPPGARTEVDPPPIEPYTYGLLTTAQVITGDGRWQAAGVEYPTNACAQGGYVLGSCPVPAGDGATSHDKPITGAPEWVEGSGPFTVYARTECNAVGFAAASETALARLRIAEAREVERFFSSQVLGASDPRLPVGSGPVPLLVALGALEQDAALFYAGQPTFHLPRWVQPWFTRDRLVSQQGPLLRTELESPVVFGGGYYDVPTAPAAPAPAAGQFWLYATGSVRAFRSAPFAHEAFDPPTNTRIAIAERTYALDHDCYVAAALVSVTDAGGA
ncbi:hypothetical protein [Streptomyces sp. NPDC048644]|uniref:hypothetical protein n=1 Tax=Streptomyces sp. NPDC048644 TaxID=3365582 RepID=UPI00371874E0